MSDGAATRSNPFDVTGRVAVVTGGTRGLGNAMARGLAAAGATVVITGRKQPAAEEAARALAAETGCDCRGIACHMGDWDQIDGARRARLRRSSAGSTCSSTTPASTRPSCQWPRSPSEFFDKLYAVNVKGPMRLAARVAHREWVRADGGSIINVVTVGAYEGGPGIGAYSSSKAALLNLTKVMAREWAGPRGARQRTGSRPLPHRHDEPVRRPETCTGIPRGHRERDAPEADRRSGGDRGGGALPGQRRLELRHRRRLSRGRRHALTAGTFAYLQLQRCAGASCVSITWTSNQIGRM